MEINFRNQIKSGAVILGGHFQGLGLIRSLYEKGVPVVLVDHEPCIGRTSRYIKHFYRGPSVLKPLEYLNFLLQINQLHNLKDWILFPTDDETVYFISIYRNELMKGFRFSIPEWNVVQNLYSKKKSYRLAKKLGIPIPKTLFPKNVHDLQNLDIEYPLIIKPAVMRDFYRKTKKKVFKVNNQRELISLYKKTLDIIPSEDIMIQELIPEVWNNLYSYCPFFKNSKSIASITAKRTRQHPLEFGHASTFAHTIKNREIEEFGCQLLSKIDYYGICEVEFVFDIRDGKYKFLEVNPRVWGWHTLAKRAGLNLPYMLFCDINQLSIQVNDYNENIKWIRLLTDVPTSFLYIKKKYLSLYEYLLSLKGEKEYAVFSWHDPLPFITELLLIPYYSKKRGF